MTASAPKQIRFLDLKAQHRPLKEEMLEAVAECIDSAAFASGDGVREFEDAFSKFVGCEHAVGVGNGTEALILAMRAVGVGPGDKVVTVPNTFIATVEAISLVGAEPVLIDVDPGTLLMDPIRLDEAVAKQKIRAIIPVHLYGLCADMDTLTEIGRNAGAIMIEDAAQAHGARYHGRSSGSLGDVAAFSFYAGKNLGAAGEAGMVTTNDPNIRDAVTAVRNHGQLKKHVHQSIGTNSRMDEIQGRILSIKLRYLEGWNETRRQIAAAYDRAFAGDERVQLQRQSADCVSSRHLYVIQVADRDGMRAHLADHNIDSEIHYPTPIHLQDCYAALGHQAGAFPHAEQSAATILSLPMHPDMSLADAERVSDTVLAGL